MKNPEKILKSVQICKSERQKARESGNGGTNWPGKMAKEAYPDILNCVFEDLDEIYCIIGTNGKTTTCRMIDNILNFAGIDHIYNREGANLPEGLLTTLLLNYDDYCVPVKKKALLECDEITFRDLSSVMSPKISGILIISVWEYAPHDTEWMGHTDFTQLFSLFDEIYTSGPCITAKTFLRYPGVLWLEEKDISEKIYSTEQNVTILTDYDGNIGIHKLLSKEGHLRQFWEE